MAADNQALRQASFRAIHGGPGSDFNSDAMRAFATEAVNPAGTTFNGAFIIWLQTRLGSSETNLADLMNAFAVAPIPGRSSDDQAGRSRASGAQVGPSGVAVWSCLYHRVRGG
jgi:hypothetical protein